MNYLKDSTGRTEVWAGAARIDDVQELRDVSRRELADITIRTEAPEATFRLYYGRAFFDPDGGAIAEGLDEILIRGFERPVHVADLLFSRKHLNSPYLARYRAGRWNKTSPLAIRAQLVAAVAGLTFFCLIAAAALAWDRGGDYDFVREVLPTASAALVLGIGACYVLGKRIASRVVFPWIRVVTQTRAEARAARRTNWIAFASAAVAAVLAAVITALLD